MVQNTEHKYKPFAITARTTGHPSKLYTPITVANLLPSWGGGEKIVATKVNAMWDTGADVCLMDRALAARLGVKFETPCNAKGIAGATTVPIGYAYISIVANGDLIDVLTGIVEKTSPSDDYSFIIGMNLIGKGSLAISATAIDTTLSFTIPCPEPIDFTLLTDIESRYKGVLPLSGKIDEYPIVYGKDALDLINPQ